MSEFPRKAPKSMSHRRIVEATYDGGVGADETFRFTITLATSRERIELDTLNTENTAGATRKVKGAEGIYSAILDDTVKHRKRGAITQWERRRYEITFDHVEQVLLVEEGINGSESISVPELIDGLLWQEMNTDKRIEWAEQHPALFRVVQEAVLPTADAEVEGK